MTQTTVTDFEIQNALIDVLDAVGFTVSNLEPLPRNPRIWHAAIKELPFSDADTLAQLATRSLINLGLNIAVIADALPGQPVVALRCEVQR